MPLNKETKPNQTISYDNNRYAKRTSKLVYSRYH